MSMETRIALVLDPECDRLGDALGNVAHLWSIASSGNAKTVAELPLTERARVSIFSADPSRALEIGVELIDDHHDEYSETGAWKSIVVLGDVRLSDAQALFVDYGARCVEIDGGVQAIRD